MPIRRPRPPTSRVLLLVGLAIAIAGTLAPARSQSEPARVYRVHLRNGEFVDADQVQAKLDRVILEGVFGRMSFRRSSVERVEILSPSGEPEAPPQTRSPKLEASPKPPLPAALRRRLEAQIVAWRQGQRTRSRIVAGTVALGPAVAPWIAAELQDPGTDVPIALLVAVHMRLRIDRSEAGIEHLLVSESAAQRRALVEGCGLAETASAARILVSALDDPEPAIADAAAAYLVTLGRDHAEFRVPSLIARDLRSSAQHRHASVLGRLATPEAVTALRRLMASNDADLQVLALQGLASAGGPEDAEGARKLLEGDHAGLRKAAAIFLGRIGCRAAVPDLIPLLSDPDRGVASSALWALRAISGLEVGAHPDLWRRWWEGCGRPKEVGSVSIPDGRRPGCRLGQDGMAKAGSVAV